MEFPDVPPGSRRENAWLFVLLLADVLSTPFHLALYLLRRAAHRARFAAILRDSRS